MTFKKFEDIEAWQLARELCKLIKQMTEKPEFSKDWDLRKQIRASSGSAMDCIAEGHERGNNAEFLYLLGVSLGSCAEVRSQLYRASDYGYISETEHAEAYGIAARTGAATRGLVEYLNKTDKPGFRKLKKPIAHKTQKQQPDYPHDPNFPTEIPPNL
jgi:four helix bundle protein